MDFETLNCSELNQENIEKPLFQNKANNLT